MDNPLADVIDVYRRNASAWVLARDAEASLYERGWLDSFLGLMPPDGTVLDLGCGSGDPLASELTRKGCAVIGVDAAPEMIAIFNRRLPTCEAHVADMRTLDLDRRFHGILAWDSFFHLSPHEQRAMFDVFERHSLRGAALMFTSGPAAGEAIGQLEGYPLYHASLDPQAYRSLLEGADFSLLRHVAEDPSCGRRTVWLAQRR